MESSGTAPAANETSRNASSTAPQVPFAGSKSSRPVQLTVRTFRASAGPLPVSTSAVPSQSRRAASAAASWPNTSPRGVVRPRGWSRRKPSPQLASLCRGEARQRGRRWFHSSIAGWHLPELDVRHLGIRAM